MMENQSKQSFDSPFLINKDVSIFLFDLSTFFLLIIGITFNYKNI
ncbi:MAG: hypothetical protein PHY80_02520 [Rickettsiales bacterium]|nr:hypothetical protein [Rickettsiales bacterium]